MPDKNMRLYFRGRLLEELTKEELIKACYSIYKSGEDRANLWKSTADLYSLAQERRIYEEEKEKNKVEEVRRS